MRNGLWMKGLTCGIILLLLGNLSCSAHVFSLSRPSTIEAGSSPTQDSFSNTTQYFAVICACSKYESPLLDLPSRWFPAPDWKLRVLYDALLQTKNWEKENIILLLNENATKENIVQALEQMATRVSPNDIFLFTWAGHGDEVPDLDGDEAQWDVNDTYDEVILPYNISNYLTDDELGYYFSNIHAKGKCLIFESCLSGDLIDRNESKTLQNDASNSERSTIVTQAGFFQNNDNPNPMDVNGNNTIVIMSTLPNMLCYFMYITHSPLLFSVVDVIKYNEKYDENKDGCLSVEEIFRIARPLTLMQSIFHEMSSWMLAYLFFKFDLYNLFFFHPVQEKFYKIIDAIVPNAKVLASCIFFFDFLYAEIQLIYSSGHYGLNWPNMRDDYPGDLPLIQL
jgi:hypothetical protein